MRRSARSLHPLLACWLLFGLAARVLVPAGFMPAPLAEGWPVVPCPGQSHGSHPAGETPDGHQGHRDDDSCESDCYQGLFFALAAEVDAVDVVPQNLPELERIAVVHVASATAHAWDAPQPRGPPLSSSDVA
jgi:hypothetical protein